MPFEPAQSPATPSEELPQHLQHKPFYALPYQAFDSLHRGYTDARYISVGLAQYNQGEVSLKVLRHTGGGGEGKWTRQSEELPLNRVIDAALFLAEVLYDSGGDQVRIPAGTFDEQTEDLLITRESRSDMERGNYSRFLNDTSVGNLLRDRYRKLYKTLAELAEEGRL